MSATNAEGRQSGGARGSGADPARIGRQAGVAVYLTLLAYAVVVGFGTFILGTFYPPTDAVTGTPDCTAERVSLASELRDQANRALAADGAHGTDSFFDAWDRRYEGLRTACAADREFRLLEPLRYRVEIQLDRFDRDTARSFRRALESATGTENPR